MYYTVLVKPLEVISRSSQQRDFVIHEIVTGKNKEGKIERTAQRIQNVMKCSSNH